MNTGLDLRPRGMLELLDLTFAVYRRNLLLYTAISSPLCLVAALLVLCCGILQGVTGNDLTSRMTANLSSVITLLMFLALAFLFAFLFQRQSLALQYACAKHLSDQTCSWREAYTRTSASFRQWWTMGSGSRSRGARLAGASFVALWLLGRVAMGWVVIGIPVIGCVWYLRIAYDAMRYSLSHSVIVQEGLPIVVASDRSTSLIEGYHSALFWRYRALDLILFVLVIVPVGALVLYLGANLIDVERFVSASGRTLSDGFFALGIIALSITLGLAGTIAAPIVSIFTTLNYLDLRIRKEHLDLALKVQAVVSPLPTETSAAQSGDPAPAIAQRIQMVGESADRYNDLGIACQDRGDLDGALHAFTQARRLDPRDASIAYNLAMLHRDRGDLAAFQEVIAEYLTLETDPAELERTLNEPGIKEYLP